MLAWEIVQKLLLPQKLNMRSKSKFCSKLCLRNILSASNLVVNGSRRRIGNGKKVKIRHLQSMRDIDKYVLVNDLIDHDMCRWKRHLIVSILCKRLKLNTFLSLEKVKHYKFGEQWWRNSRERERGCINLGWECILYIYTWVIMWLENKMTK